jgi:hypothetical protein
VSVFYKLLKLLPITLLILLAGCPSTDYFPDEAITPELQHKKPCFFNPGDFRRVLKAHDCYEENAVSLRPNRLRVFSSGLLILTYPKYNYVYVFRADGAVIAHPQPQSFSPGWFYPDENGDLVVLDESYCDPSVIMYRRPPLFDRHADYIAYYYYRSEEETYPRSTKVVEIATKKEVFDIPSLVVSLESCDSYIHLITDNRIPGEQKFHYRRYDRNDPSQLVHDEVIPFPQAVRDSSLTLYVGNMDVARGLICFVSYTISGRLFFQTHLIPRAWVYDLNESRFILSYTERRRFRWRDIALYLPDTLCDALTDER